jgi:hypothetical protein
VSTGPQPAVVPMSGNFLGIPINRIVAWLGPTIAIIASALAAWLVAKVNILGLAGLNKSNLQTYITAGVTFGVAAGLHALGGLSWLRGHHIQLAQTKE